MAFTITSKGITVDGDFFIKSLGGKISIDAEELLDIIQALILKINETTSIPASGVLEASKYIKFSNKSCLKFGQNSSFKFC